MRRAVLALAVSALLMAAAPALAHIDITPTTATAGSTATLSIDVPNERSRAATVEIAVRMADGVTDAQPLPVDGWRPALGRDGGYTVIRWTGGELTGDGATTFRFRARIPDSVGARLVFPATQTYSNGDVDRWIEPDDSEFPAPVVSVVSADGSAGSAAGSSGAPTGWLIGGTIAALVAIGALVVVRRRRSDTPS